MNTFDFRYTLDKGKPKPPDPFGRILEPIDLILGLSNADHLVGNGSKNLVEVGKVSGAFFLQHLGSYDTVQNFQVGQNQLELSTTLQVESLGLSQVSQNTLAVWEGQSVAQWKGINASPISATDFVAA